MRRSMIKWTSDLLYQLRIFLSQVVIIPGHLPLDKSVSFEIDTSYFVITQVHNDPMNLRKSISCLADARPSLSMTADSCDEQTSTTHNDKLMFRFYCKLLPEASPSILFQSSCLPPLLSPVKGWILSFHDTCYTFSSASITFSNKAVFVDLI